MSEDYTRGYDLGYDSGFEAGRHAEYNHVLLMLREIALEPAEEHPDLTEAQWHFTLARIVGDLRLTAPDEPSTPKDTACIGE